MMYRVLARDEPDFLGFQSLISRLDDIVFEILDDRFQGSKDEILFDYVSKIHDHTMAKLMNLLWHADRQRNPTDIIYRSKVASFAWLEPHHIELTDADTVVNAPMW